MAPDTAREAATTGVAWRLWRYALAGLAGGALVYLVEVADRTAALWPHFASPAEALLYALYLAPDLLLGLAAGVVLGAALAAAGALREAGAAVARRAGGVASRYAGLAGALFAVAVLTAAAVAASALWPELLAEPLRGVAQKVNQRLVRIPTIVQNFTPMLALGFALSAAALVALDWALTARVKGPRRAVALVPAAALLALQLGLYYVDSRLFFARYEYTMHLPALAAQFACVTLAAGFLLAAFGADVRRRRAAAAALAVAALASCAFAFDVWHLGSNENLNTLLWRRSVAARRAYQGLSYLTDRDGDGFSALFDGDLDDSDPRVHPLATEVAGNGVNDNCIGGDGVAGAEVVTAAEAPPAAAPPGTARNFLLISVDTLRANRMSAYGYGRPTSPRLEEWGARALFLERGYAQGSNTGNSFASMQRSATRGAIFERGAPTLFGRLSEAGFRTAFVNARRDDEWLKTRRWTKYRKVILDGVDAIDHTDGEELWDADRVTDRAIEYLASLPEGERHATWVHYLDPHEPRRKMAPFDWGDSDSDEYDTEVAFADMHVGRLLDWLRDSGRLEDTLVVLVADHGESFLEHGVDLHGNRPYDEQVHVPFMIWAPDVAPSRIAEPVGLIDLAPTALAYFGLEPLPRAQGSDLRVGAHGRPVFSETPLNLNEVSWFAFGVTAGEWRYIWDVRGNTVELYNLAEDPRELRNLADARPEKAAEMRAILARWLDGSKSVRSMREA